MHKIFIALFIFGIALGCNLALAKPLEPLIYLRPNETPLFTELYQRYGLLNPPLVHVFDSSLYLGQPGETGLVIPSSQVFFDQVEKTLKAYHTRLNNLDLFIDPHHKTYVFCPTNGSLQTIFGLVYAIAHAEPQKRFLFVEKIPFYSFHEHAVNYRPYPNARFQGFHDPKEIKLEPNETLVEFVTSPNNPDGTMRTPYSKADIIIADFVFAAPSFGKDGRGYVKENLLWIDKARKEKKHIFAFNSVSKSLGKPGFRLGYMWFPTHDAYAKSIFHEYFSYIWKLTVGPATPGIADALNLITALLALPDAGQSLRNDFYKTIVKRHGLVKAELVKRFPQTEVTSIEGSPTLFAKLHSKELNSKTAAEILLKTANVSADNGNSMGATNDYIRINLCGASEDLAASLNRLAQSNKYSEKDVFISSANHCTKLTIRSQDTTSYVINPNDCSIDIDAQHGNVHLIAPEFINYRQSNLITIKKIDNTKHTITLTINKQTLSLSKKDETLRLQWRQPLSLNGQWHRL